MVLSVAGRISANYNDVSANTFVYFELFSRHRSSKGHSEYGNIVVVKSRQYSGDILVLVVAIYLIFYALSILSSL
jgi:hypothetical protein